LGPIPDILFRHVNAEFDGDFRPGAGEQR
jgi:hypothetical protein